VLVKPTFQPKLAPPLPPAPAPNQRVRIPLDQLAAYLQTYGLVITRRVDTPAGAWYVELQDATAQPLTRRAEDALFHPGDWG
jgi:hypothetical protein